MRVVRAGIVAAVAACVLVIPAAASAQVDQVSIGDPQLGPEGASVSVPLTIVCDVGYNIAFGDVSVAQSTGHKLALGFGSFSNDFPGVPCTGASQTVTATVTTATSFAFKQGKASGSADVSVFNPVTGDLPTESVGPQAIRIRK